MGNMSYCRFQNTLGDLQDCARALDEEEERDDMSEDEASARDRLLLLCEKIADQHSDVIDALKKAKAAKKVQHG